MSDSVPLLICKHCEHLLMKYDVRFIQIEQSCINENGDYYDVETFAPEFDTELCPICCNSHLDNISISKDTFKSIYNLWSMLEIANEYEGMDTTDFGISLDNPILKEILMEVLL